MWFTTLMSAEMTSKERLLCALDRGKPDRLPVSVHQCRIFASAARECVY
jgi:hypothetical protein